MEKIKEQLAAAESALAAVKAKPGVVGPRLIAAVENLHTAVSGLAEQVEALTAKIAAVQPSE